VGGRVGLYNSLCSLLRAATNNTVLIAARTLACRLGAGQPKQPLLEQTPQILFTQDPALHAPAVLPDHHKWTSTINNGPRVTKTRILHHAWDAVTKATANIEDHTYPKHYNRLQEEHMHT
jgi:hypothetical protein